MRLELIVKSVILVYPRAAFAIGCTIVGEDRHAKAAAIIQDILFHRIGGYDYPVAVPGSKFCKIYA